MVLPLTSGTFHREARNLSAVHCEDFFSQQEKYELPQCPKYGVATSECWGTIGAGMMCAGKESHTAELADCAGGHLRLT